MLCSTSAPVTQPYGTEIVCDLPADHTGEHVCHAFAHLGEVIAWADPDAAVTPVAVSPFNPEEDR